MEIIVQQFSRCFVSFPEKSLPAKTARKMAREDMARERTCLLGFSIVFRQYCSGFLKKKSSKPSNFSNQSNYTFQTRKSVRIYFLKFFYQKTTFVENVDNPDNYPNEKSIHTNFSFIKPEQR